MQPAGVVSAPAAGADLIVLDEARDAPIPLHVFLPIEVDEFVRASVADHDTEWLGLFETVMDHARDDPRSSVCRDDGDATRTGTCRPIKVCSRTRSSSPPATWSSPSRFARRQARYRTAPPTSSPTAPAVPA